MTRDLITCLLAAGVALTSGACGLLASETVVMVSGRDDHGDLQRRALGLQVSPRDPTIAATALDGEIALVIGHDGPWANVRLVRSGEQGWIEDHYLRGEAVWTAPYQPLRVTFAGAEVRPDGVFVRVHPRDGSPERWVHASELKEVGAR